MPDQNGNTPAEAKGRQAGIALMVMGVIGTAAGVIMATMPGEPLLFGISSTWAGAALALIVPIYFIAPAYYMISGKPAPAFLQGVISTLTPNDDKAE